MEVVQHEGADQQPPPGPGLRGEQQQQQRHKESRHLLQEPAEPGRAAARLRGRVAAVPCAVLHLPQKVSAPTHHQTPAQVRHDGLAALHHTRQQPRGGGRRKWGRRRRRRVLHVTYWRPAFLLSRSQKKRETEGRGVCVCTFIFLSVASSLPPI